MPPTDLQAGTLLDDRFEILKKLAEGAGASVYQARQVSQDILLKVLHPSLYGDAERQNRFLRAARMLTRVKHKNILVVYDIGIHDGHPYAAMEYVPGEDLQQALEREKRLSASRSIKITVQLCDALQAVHETELVHRDLTPQNVWISANDAVKLIDFGPARISDGQIAPQSTTKEGMLLGAGSPAYMSPEQCRAENVDARSDIYSLGCILYKMLTGDPPFKSESAVGYVSKHEKEQPAPLTAHIDQIPQGLQAALSKALEKEPSNRYESVAEFRVDLQAVKDSPAPNRGAHPSKGKSGKKSKNANLVAVLALLLVAAGGAYFVFKTLPNTNKRSPDPVQAAGSTNKTYREARDLMESKQYTKAAERFAASIAEYEAKKKAQHGKLNKLDCYGESLSYQCRANCDLMLNKPRLAIPDLNRAIKLRPNCQENYLNRARAYELVGKPDLALSDHQKAKTLKPDTLPGEQELSGD